MSKTAEQTPEERAEQKALLRATGIAARRALSHEEHARLDEALCARAASLPCFAAARTVMSYRAVRGEADLSALHAQCRALGKTLCFPVCGEGRTLLAAVPADDGAWAVGAYGIPAPDLRRSLILAPERIDLVIVPCAAFDAQLRRIGQGGGYYDRFLPECANAVRLGAAYEVQRAAEIPPDAWDAAPDLIVTEAGVYRRAPGGRDSL